MCANGTDDCPGQELHCIDGTRPVYYVDPADDLNSKKWLFVFQGGGSCSQVDDVTSGGVDCFDRYTEVDGGFFYKERDEMSRFLLDESGHLVGPQRSIIGTGAIKPTDPNAPNDFSSYHRVKIHKCSYDRFTGRTMRTDLHGANCPAGKDCSNREDDPVTGGKPQNAAGDSFNLRFDGWWIIEAVLADLRDGTTVSEWNGISETVHTLPPLAAPDTRLVLAGHSGGAYGLTYNLDRIADLVGAWNDPPGEVYGVIDAKAWPGIDHEESLLHPGDDMYDHNWGSAECDSTIQTCLPPDAGGAASTDFSDETFRLRGDTRMRSIYRGAIPDESCLSHHPKAWRCHEPIHVIFNHTETPFFLRQALRDQSHTQKAPEYAVDRWNYVWDESEYTARVVAQAQTFVAERHLPWSQRGWGERVYYWAQPTMRGVGLFYPDETKHSGVFHQTQFFEVELDNGAGCMSYHDALSAWLDGTGDQVYIEGHGATACP
jgi:hypothetical protein